MSASLARIGAVAWNDVLIRVRRPSTIAVVLVLCALAYMLVPAISSGQTLMQLEGHRAYYNSATIAIATAGLATMLLGLLGFYLVSNTVRRDVVTRTGFVIAAMPVTNAEYLVGKFLGNFSFLGLIVLAYMLNVMGMHLLRGEAPLQPLVYLSIYLAMAGPAIVIVSGVALLFECVPPLSGRAGDVLYFFVWLVMVALVAVAGNAPASGLGWQRFSDILGLQFMMQQVRGTAGADNISIGHSPFDPSLEPWTFPGVHWSWQVAGTRIGTALLVIPLLLLALLVFARFDPARIKGGAAHVHASILARLNGLLKPVTRVLVPLIGRGRGLVRIGLAEFTLTMMLAPLSLVLWGALSVWALLAEPPKLMVAVLPVIFLVITASIADMATRDAAAGTTALLFSLPRVRPTYVMAKFIGAALVALAFLAVPVLRIGVTSPPLALSLVVGGLFVAALAVSLGRLTGSGKAFVGLFLLFLYITMSSGGAAPMDFAGMQGVATTGVRLGYLAAAAVLVAFAVARHRASRNAST